jgi:hypothetical protein
VGESEKCIRARVARQTRFAEWECGSIQGAEARHLSGVCSDAGDHRCAIARTPTVRDDEADKAPRLTIHEREAHIV